MANRVQLIVWDPKVAEIRAATLRAEGYEVQFDLPDGPEFLRNMRTHPPAAIVIDLERGPGTGRDLALTLRKAVATREIPIVFIGGADGKAAGVRTKLPDAFYAEWKHLTGTVARAIREKVERPHTRPVAPKSVFEGYSDTPLLRKLAVKPGSTVVYHWLPDGFLELLGEQSEGVTLKRGVRGEFAKALWFVRSTAELEREIDFMAERAGKALWIFWPKMASGVRSGITQQVIRSVAKRAGLTDYKICSVDETWSGMLFTNSKPDAATPLKARRMAK